MTVVADAQQNGVEDRPRAVIAKRRPHLCNILLRGFGGQQLAAHPVNVARWNRHMIKQGPPRHAEIAVVVVGRHTPLVAPPNLHPRPINLLAARRLRQQTVHRFGGRAARQHPPPAPTLGDCLPSRRHQPVRRARHQQVAGWVDCRSWLHHNFLVFNWDISIPRA